MIEHLHLQSRAWGIELDSSQLALLSAYADLLVGYELANVIGVRNRDRIIVEHLVDALSCYVIEDFRLGRSLIDVGTGGGLPGIPLAIARPELRVALLEVTEKKVRFLRYARASLGLQNLEVVHARVEEAGAEPEYRESFDLATARALAGLPVAVEYCTPLVRPGGAIIAMKGRLPEEELSIGVAAAHQLGVEVREVREVKYRAELLQKERRLVVLNKVEPTPSKFPRRVGLAKKRPLGT